MTLTAHDVVPPSTAASPIPDIFCPPPHPYEHRFPEAVQRVLHERRLEEERLRYQAFCRKALALEEQPPPQLGAVHARLRKKLEERQKRKAIEMT